MEVVGKDFSAGLGLKSRPGGARLRWAIAQAVEGESNVHGSEEFIFELVDTPEWVVPYQIVVAWATSNERGDA
jgi:hypothetical protein